MIDAERIVVATRVRNKLSRVVGVSYAIPVLVELLRFDPDFEAFVMALDATPVATSAIPDSPAPDSPITRAWKLLEDLEKEGYGSRKIPGIRDA